MQCPTCNKEMQQVRQDESYDRKRPRTYTRTVFHCEDDDTWVGVEVPQT